MSIATTEESTEAVLSNAELMPCDSHSTQNWLDRFYSRLVLKKLGSLKTGRIVLHFECGEAVVGDLHCTSTPAVVNIHSTNFFRRLVLEGAIGAAESYMDGEWTTPDLTKVIRVLIQNEETLGALRTGRFSPIHALRRVEHFRNRNSRSGSRKNIHEHYDLGNEFFSLFLDESMMYSSAVFPTAETPLLDASWEKVDRVCRTLELSPDDHVAEIGTGWGGFACHAAQNYGCRVTTTTISDEQHAFAKNRIHEMGLEDKVTLLKKDYRELTGTYDRLVSLEMIEAVGKRYLPEYFATCNRLVKHDGAMMLQAITMPEQRYDQYVGSVDFIQKHIFPGGFLPSITEMQNCVKLHTSFRMLDLKDFGAHYAKTLNHWNERFHARLDEVRDQGFSERFIRMWRYYMCYCEAAFLERATGLVQTVWAKPDSMLGRL